MSGSAESLLSKLTLKLVIDTKASKVLFAEADNVFVDFILGILALPVGALMRLIKEKEDLVGSLGALYNSVDKLNDAYMKTAQVKGLLLQSDVVAKCYHSSVPSLKWEGATASIKKLYKCNSDNNCLRVSDEYGRKCPVHGQYMRATTAELSYIDPLSTASISLSGVEGFVKDLIPCMVMDDLSVQPLSSAHILDVISNVKDANGIKEITVQVGEAEVSKLLKAVLNSKSALTDVFLKGSIDSQDTHKQDEKQYCVTMPQAIFYSDRFII